MGVLTESARRVAEFLISEAEHYRSRDAGIVAPGSGVTYEAGMVLGKITATSKLVAWDPAAENGSEDVHSVLFEEIIGTAGEPEGRRTFIRRMAQVKKSKLAWKAGTSAGNITAGIAALEALGIIVREEA